MFEREYRKEKNLEAIKKQQELAKKGFKGEITNQKEKWEKKKLEMITAAEKAFADNLTKNPPLQEDEDPNEKALDSPEQPKKTNLQQSVNVVQP